jgi:hypothetical protein
MAARQLASPHRSSGDRCPDNRQRSRTMRATDCTQCRVNPEIREVRQSGTVSDHPGTGLAAVAGAVRSPRPLRHPRFPRLLPPARRPVQPIEMRSPASLAGIVRLPRRQALTHEGRDRSAALQSESVATYRHKKSPEPGTRCDSTREGLPFYPLKPKARLARALVELDPRHALAP